MSWDIFIQHIPADARRVGDIPADFQPRPLGSRAEIIRRIQDVMPAATFSDPSWGVLDGSDFSIEFNLGTDEDVTSVALHVRGGDAAAGAVADLLERCGWRALDPGSESGMFDAATAADSLTKWRAYRHRTTT